MPIDCRMCSDTSISRRGISREPCGSGSIRSLAGAAALKRRRPCEFRDHAAILTTTLCEKAVRHQAHQQRRQVPGTRPQRLRGMSTLPSTCQTCSCYLYMDVISNSPRRSIGSNGARSHLASCISRRCGVGGGGGRSCSGNATLAFSRAVSGATACRVTRSEILILPRLPYRVLTRGYDMPVPRHRGRGWQARHPIGTGRWAAPTWQTVYTRFGRRGN